MANTSQLPARQHNKLQPMPKAAKSNFESEIDTAWNLYREQLKRNFELMQIISELQQVIGQVTTINLPQIRPVETIEKQEVLQPEHPMQEVQQKFKDIESIPMQRFGKVEQVFKLMSHNIKRKDAVQSLIEMLSAIHQLDEVNPERLYMQLGIPDSSGYRYARNLQKLRLVKCSRGKLSLTKAGLLLMNNPLENAEDFKLTVTQLLDAGLEIYTNSPVYRDALIFFDKQSAKL